jgi:hypothetical protein
MLRRLSAARADVGARLGAATGDRAAALEQIASDLRAAYAPLPALFDALQEADARPIPTVEAAATAAIKRAEVALARAGS